MVKNTLKRSRWLFIMLLAVLFFAVPCTMAEDSHAATVSTDKDTYTFGERIYASAGSYSDGDWIGLYDVGEIPKEGVTPSYWWIYASSTGTDLYSRGQGGFTARWNDNLEEYMEYDDYIPPGKYDVVLAGADYSVKARKTITVKGIKTDKTSYGCGDDVNVSFYLQDGIQQAQYYNWWVGLYEENTTPADGNSIYWYWLATADGGNRAEMNILEGTGAQSSLYKLGGKYKIVLFAQDDFNNILDTTYITFDHHNYDGGKITTAATCGKDGVKTYTCTCGEKKTETIKATGNHNWNAATCTAPKTCGTCGTTEGQAKGHAWNAANCTTPKTCGTCGTTEGQALGHAWNAANCTTPKTCGTCGTTEGQALGHAWNAANCTTPKTCGTCGATEGTANGHAWNAANCTTPKTCGTCGTTEGTANGHAWNAATCTAPKTCGTCGTTKGEALGHSWNEATCTAPKSCQNCTATEGTMLGHDWDEGIVAKAATCMEAGVLLYTCKNDANHTKTTELDIVADAHDWDDGIVARAATCMETGVMLHTCKHNCGNTKREEIAIDADAHDWDAGVVQKEANCAEEGLSYHVCKHNAEHTWNEVLPINGDAHKWEAATCTTAKYCIYHKGTEGNPLGHDMAPATCEAASKCTRCEHTEGEALGHHEGPEATCTTAQICTNNCGKIYANALGHDMAAATCTNPAVCKRNCGYTEGSCKGHTPGPAATCKEPQKCLVCSTTLMNAHHEAPADMAQIPVCKDVTCTKCDFVLRPATPVHSWQAATCDTPKTCILCQITTEQARGHEMTDATCTSPKICKYGCGHTEGTALGHQPNGKATCDTASTCTRCYTVLERAKGHRAGLAATCTTAQTCLDCGITLTPALQHHEETLKGVAPTCTAEGISDGIICSTCGDILKVQSGLAKLSHSVAKTDVEAATTKADGKIVKSCSCGAVIATESIAKVATVKLSYTKTVYNGKKKSPKVTVTDSNGNVLTRYEDYDITLPSGRAKVGKYTYKITFKGDYAGTKNVTMTIIPGMPTIQNPKAAAKAVTVKWKKVSSQASGYQVMVATNSKFTKNKKSVTVKGAKTVSKKVTGLKAKKTYYVKVRTYRVVNGVKIYSNWSKVKKVKTL